MHFLAEGVLFAFQVIFTWQFKYIYILLYYILYRYYIISHIFTTSLSECRTLALFEKWLDEPFSPLAHLFSQIHFKFKDGPVYFVKDTVGVFDGPIFH